jgi:uncharacterized protein (DUF302 family)
MVRVAAAAFVIGLGWAGAAGADTPPGYVVVRSSKSIAALETDLKAAIDQKSMNVVNRASASDGARNRGASIRGDVVIGVYRNDFAVRMLAASVDAGLEAPIRLHLVEEPDGTSSIRYRTPSAVFAPYGGGDLQALGVELDAIMAAIVAAAAAPH